MQKVMPMGLGGRTGAIGVYVLFALTVTVVLIMGDHPGSGTDPGPSRKTTYMVMMDDGVSLATDVHSPTAQEGPWGSILVRTPYDRERSGIYAHWADLGYNGIAQDVRGSYDSEGVSQFPLFWDAASDGNDTLDWIVSQPFSDGRVATYGGSALGVAQYFMAGQGNPALKAQFITQAPPDMYHYSAFQGGEYKPLSLGALMVDNSPSYKQSVYDNENFSYAFWGNISLLDKWSNVNVPAIHAGGWWDPFSEGIIDGYTGYNDRGGPMATGRSKLVMGPWTHGDITTRTKFGEVQFPPDSVGGFTEAMFYDMLEQYILGTTQDLDTWPNVTYYLMGDDTDPDAPGMEWRYSDVWPVPSQSTTFYLRAGGGLDTIGPQEENASSSYDYDPADPVPTKGGQNFGSNSGPMDQRSVEGRDDVLLFETEVLDRPLEATGRISAHLYVSSDREDTDFTVKVTDVYPDGRSMLVADGIVRMRNRNGDDHWEFMDPGTVYGVDVDLWSTSYVWNEGHRIRVAISSSNYPRFLANPNTRDGIYKNTDVLTARNTVYFDMDRPSALVLPVVDGSRNSPVELVPTPGKGDVWIHDMTSVNLSVRAIDEDPANVTFEWSVDGVRLAGTDRTWFLYSAVGEGDAEHDITVSAADPANSSMVASVTWKVHVTNVDAPLVVTSFSPGDPVVLDEAENGSVVFTIAVSDEDPYPDTFRWFLNGAPADVDAGRFVFRYDMWSSGNYLLRATVEDAFGAVSKDWHISIMDVNRPPGIVDLKGLPGTITIDETEEAPVDFLVEVQDADLDPVETSWYLDGLPSGTGPGYSFVNEDPGGAVHSVEVMADDGKDQSFMNWTLVVLDVDLPLRWGSLEPAEANITLKEGEMEYLEFQAVPVDPDGDLIQPVWALDGILQEGSAQYFVLHVGSFTSGTYLLNVSARDDVSEIWNSWRIVVIDVNRPPVIVRKDPPSGTVVIDGPTEFEAAASDPDGDALLYVWSWNGTQAAQGEDLTDFQVGTDLMGADGIYDLSVNISDGKGGAVDAHWNVIIDRTGPVVPPPDGDDGGTDPLWILIGLIALFAVSAALLLFAMSMRRKGKEEDGADPGGLSE